MKLFLILAFLVLFSHAYKYDENFSCSSISAEISLKTSNYLDTSVAIDNKYKLIKKEISNDVDNYERWLARDIKTGKYIHIKLYVKGDHKELWRYKDSYSLPNYECTQLNYISHLINKQNQTEVVFETCIIPDNSGDISNIPYYNAFTNPLGDSLSQYCIMQSCRDRLKFIGQALFKALKVLATGPTSYFKIENINSDNIFFYERGLKRFITITDFRYNKEPENDKFS